MLFNNWNISGCIKFRMLDNKTSSFDVAGDIPEGWSWQLLYSCNGNLNIVEMQHEENILSVIFTKEMLPTDGTYLFQLKATKGDLVKHTNIVKTYVNKSLSGDIKWPVIPTEFTQIEQVVKGYAESAKESSIKAENAAVHSPIIGENGNWFVWDFTKSEYVDTGKPSSTPPITPETAGKYLTNDGSKAEWGVLSGGSDLSLGITGAQVGQIAKITAVDTNGKPTAWEPVDMPDGGSGGKQLLYRHNISQDAVLTTDSFDTSGANIDLSVYSHLYIRGMFICNSPKETYGRLYLNGTNFYQIQYFNRKIGQTVGFEADIICLKTQNKSSAALLSFAWCSEFNLKDFDNIYVGSGGKNPRVNDNLQSIGFSAAESADIFAVKAGSYVEVWGD